MIFQSLVNAKNYQIQAKVIQSICEFKEGQLVTITLISNDMVYVEDMTTGYDEEFNMDTHADYDEYFEIEA